MSTMKILLFYYMIELCVVLAAASCRGRIGSHMCLLHHQRPREYKKTLDS